MKRFFILAFSIWAPILLTGQTSQVLDPAKLLKPPTDAWPTYNGDYSGRRFSTLRQINQLNVIGFF